MTRSATEVLNFDLLLTIFSMVDSVASLRTLKAVCKDFRVASRLTLCDVEWLARHNVSLHGLLKLGSPSPRLAVSLAKACPTSLQQRDGDGFLPLQYAAAYKSKFDDALVTAIREVTVKAVPGSAWPGRSDEALRLRGSATRGLKKSLRPVETRVSRQYVVGAAVA